MNFKFLRFFSFLTISLCNTKNYEKKKSISFSSTSATVSIMPSNFIHGKTLFASIQLTLFFLFVLKECCCAFFSSSSSFVATGRNSDASEVQMRRIYNSGRFSCCCQWICYANFWESKLMHKQYQIVLSPQSPLHIARYSWLELFVALDFYSIDRSIDWMIVNCF